MRNPFRYFNSSLEVIRPTVMMYVRWPLSLRQVEDMLFERGIDIDQDHFAVLVESVRSDVRPGDPEQAIHRSTRLMATAPGRTARPAREIL
jgi:transposase-like protein